MYTEPPNWKDLLFAGTLILILPLCLVLTTGFLLFDLESLATHATPKTKPSPSASAEPASIARTSPTPKPSPTSTPKPTPTPFALQENNELSAEIKRLAQKHRLANPGVMVVNLKTGAAGLLNANKSFPSASVIKLPLMYGVFREIETGKLAPQNTVKIEKKNLTASVRLNTDKEPPLKAGQSISIEKLTQLMISRSDNVATNTLMDQIDREGLNQHLQTIGLKNTRLAHKLSGTSRRIKDTDYKSGRNTTTAWDMGSLLVSLATNQLLSSESNQTMLSYLGQQLDKTKIPARLPKGVKVYHKTGEASRATHDIAIIKSAKSHYILSLLSDRARGSLTYRNMAKFSLDLYTYMEKQAG